MVVGRGPNSSSNDAMWLCQCRCGNTSCVRGADLRRGAVKSCGCERSERIRAEGLKTHTHEASKTRLYVIWRGIKARCENPNEPAFPRYGGRGIRCLWVRFEDFRDWALANGYEATKWIDRYPNKLGHYESNNCRWVTPKESNRNKTTNRFVTALGETKLLCEWMEDNRCAVKPGTLKKRLQQGWPDELAVTAPVGHKREKN